MSKLFKSFSVARIVLILHATFVILTVVGLFLATVQGSLPKNWAVALSGIVGIVGALAAGTMAVIKFLDGSQKFDALKARNADMQPPYTQMHFGNAGTGATGTTPTLTPSSLTPNGSNGGASISFNPLESGQENEDGPTAEELAEPDGHVDQVAADTWVKTRQDQITAEPEKES